MMDLLSKLDEEFASNLEIEPKEESFKFELDEAISKIESIGSIEEDDVDEKLMCVNVRKVISIEVDHLEMKHKEI